MDLIQWDIALFKTINSGMSNSLFDTFLPWFREPLFWVPLYVFVIAFVFFNYGKKAYWFVLFVIMTVSTSDMTSSRLIKKTVKRLRPCNTEYIHTIERVRCGSGYSFTSSHAANHFAVATFIILTLGQYKKKIKPWFWSWAAIISFSQIYVGVHFPLDIIGGTLMGIIIGMIWARLYNRYYGFVFDQTIDANE